jgi:hypothetical protein
MDRKWNFKTIALSSIVLGALIFGCKKHDLTKVAGITFDQNLAVPIGYGEFGVHDLLKSIDNTIQVNPSDGGMSLVYHKQLDTIYAKDVVKLDDFSQNFSIVPANLSGNTSGSFNGTINNSTSQNFTYTTQNGTELHDLNFQAGTLAINVSSTIEHNITLVITFPDLKLNGTVLTKTISMIYPNSVPHTGSGTIDLTNVLADFTANNTATNTLRINIDATITGTGQPITGSENLDLTMNLTNLEFKNITGYFGQQTLASFADSMLLKVFNNPIQGSLSFTNPKLTFTVENSFGIPITVNFNNLSTVNTVSNQTTQITFNNPVQTVNIPANMGDPAVSTSFELSNATTNNTMTNLVDAAPKYLKYDISATSNPNGNPGPLNLNFIESTSKMIVKADIELPFEGYASGMEVKDTLKFDAIKNAPDQIESVLFRLKVDNGFPLTFNGQAEFVDINYNHLFDLFDSPTDIISAAPVNSTTHIVNGTTTKSTDVIISASKIALLDKVRFIILKGEAETTKPLNTVVKLLDGYKIGLKLSVQVQLKGK